MMSLAAGDLHLWLARRDSFSAAAAFIRSTLSRYTASAEADLRFTRGENGKPSLVSGSASPAFNFSDSSDWMALAVSSGAAVGVDLEYCDDTRQVMRLARRCFNAAEIADVQACSDAARIHRFYQYWTLKEARIKAAGGSLGRELESTGFTLEYPSGETDLAPGRITALNPGGTGRAWYGLLRPVPEYCLALCCLSPRDFSRAVRLFEWSGHGTVHEQPVSLRAIS